MNSKNAVLSLLVGMCAGITSAIFLHLLKFATDYRLSHPFIIWFLPLAGLFIGVCYHFYGREASRGSNLILEEIHNPKNVVPLRMAPMVLLGTILTHLFGGSAGREGTAVQMSASLADNLSRYFRAQDRTILLMAGAGAGFGSAIGAPIAGMIFGMEVLSIGKLKISPWPYCLIASFTGYYASLLLQSPHTHYMQITNLDYNFKTLLSVLVAGILFGLTARLFSLFTHFIEKYSKRWIPLPYLIPFVSGFVIIGFYYVYGSLRYAGLGIDVIQASLTTPLSFQDPALKTFFTSLTVGTGFKGGEFVPLVFIGSTLGSALSVILPAGLSLLAAVGFAAVFAGAANTPLACSIMAAEIFGWHVLPFALIACYTSYFFSGHKGIYHAQRIHKPKLIQNILDRNIFLSRFTKR